MYRFLLRPRWLAFHALVLVGVIVMINLAFWQLRRLDERREFNAEVEAQLATDPRPLDQALASVDDIEDLEWAAVTVSGTYTDGQVVVFNRSLNGAAGENVLTALRGTDGSLVLINRGFIPLGDPVPEPPDGETTVLGRVRLAEERGRGGLTDSTEGPLTEVRRVDLDRLAPQFPGDLAPVYVELAASEPEVTESDPTPVPAPELDQGPHLSYAIQWLIFAACVLIGWVLAVRKSIRSRHADAQEPRVPDEPSPTTV